MFKIITVHLKTITKHEHATQAKTVIFVLKTIIVHLKTITIPFKTMIKHL